MKKLGWPVAVLLTALLTLGLFWQHRSLKALRAENAALSATSPELDRLREEVERLRKAAADAGEIERARQSQAELLRLRGEVSRLREQIKAARQSVRSAEGKAAASAEPATAEDTAAPIQLYTATLRATLTPQQTLVLGGWKLPNGSRGVVLLESSPTGNPDETGQITIEARFVELPEEMMDKTDLGGMRMQGRESTAQSVLEADRSQRLREHLDNTPDVSVTSIPTVTTRDGRQAQVKVVELWPIDGVEHEIGPTLNIVPTISADGKSVEMTVLAQLRLKSSPKK